MTVIGDRLRKLTDIRRETRECEHVAQGAHIHAKLLMRDYNIFVCADCDGKVMMIDEFGKPALPRPQ